MSRVVMYVLLPIVVIYTVMEFYELVLYYNVEIAYKAAELGLTK